MYPKNMRDEMNSPVRQRLSSGIELSHQRLRRSDRETGRLALQA